jgi:hypothetical protein
MSRPRTSISPTRLQDAFLCLGAAAYFLGFLAAIEVALWKLSY